jgi:hypothetical protein
LTHPPVAPSPFLGLIPFTEADAPWFFGREDECRVILANLRVVPLTLLYGASGVGKTSLLSAGVVRSQEMQRGMQNGPHRGAVAMVNAWRDDPVQLVSAAIEHAVMNALGVSSLAAASPTADLVETLRSCAERLGGPLFVLLDHFEDYLLYHANESAFATALSRAVNDGSLPASFLISIREDALSRLDYLEGRIPTLFDNLLRLDHLKGDSARAAIRGPIEQFNEASGAAKPVAIEPELVEAVLEQTAVGIDRTGVRTGGESPVETSFLQLVMRRMWQVEVRDGSGVLRLETLHSLGGAQMIVQGQLQGTINELSLDEQEVASKLFRYLVTPSGQIIALGAEDLASLAQVPLERVHIVLERLTAIRVLRPVAPPGNTSADVSYELFHDLLAAVVLDWRERFREKRVPPQDERVVRRLWLAVAILSALLIGMTAVATAALTGAL